MTFNQVPQDMLAIMQSTEAHINQLNIIEHSFLELLRYHISQLNNCAYCIDMHFKESIKHGETPLRLTSASVWPFTNYFNKKEQALLKWTELVTHSNYTVKERQLAFDDLNTHFVVAEIANITFTIIQMNSWTKISKACAFLPGAYKVS